MNRQSFDVVVIDRDDYSASVLLDELNAKGFGSVVRVNASLALRGSLTGDGIDVVVFNYHSDHPDSLNECSTARLLAPEAAIVALVSAGPSMKRVRDWANLTKCIDVVIEKPLSDERFFMVLRDLGTTRRAARVLQARAQRLENLLPEAAVSAVDVEHGEEAEMFEAAVVFTDIRRSSQMIAQLPPRDFFRLLNESLSAQAGVVSESGGAAVKFTGDGLMAVFRGLGKSHLALRCALELARGDAQRILPFGVGAAEGLVLAGLIGDSGGAGQKRQYDVIGVTVHLAARLCNMAKAAEAMATRGLCSAARIRDARQRSIGTVAVRGFDNGVECVAYDFSQPIQSPGA